MKVVVLMLRRSLFRRKAFAAAVVLLSGALTMIVATAVASLAANSSRYDDAYSRTDSPDAVLSFPSPEFDSTDAAYSERSSLVARATVTRAYQGTVENTAHRPTSILVVPASTLTGAGAEGRLALALQFGLLTSLGAILGALGSLVAAPALTRFFLATNGILPGDLHLSPAPWLVAAAVVTAGNLVVLNSTRHAIKVTPIAAARGRGRLWTRRRSPTITLQRLSRLPLNLRIAVRQVLAHPSQYLALGLSCLLFGFLLTVISGGTLRFTDAQVVACSLGLPRADLSVSVLDPHQNPDAAAESVAERLARQQPIRYVSSFEQINVSAAGTQVIAMVYGSFPPDTKPEQGLLPRAAGDIMISSYLADRLGTGVGDTLQIAADSGEPRPFTITGVYQSVNNVGLTVEILRSGYATVNPGHRFTPFLVDYAATPASTVLDDVVAAEASRGTGIQVERGDQAIANLVSTVQAGLTLLDVLLQVIALTVSGVITTFLALTAVVKETTDLGVMKAMGYPSRILRRHLSARLLVVASAGTLVGELAAGLLGSRVLGLVLTAAGLSRLDVAYHPAVIVGVFCAMPVVTLTVATLATRNVTKVSPTTLVTE